MSGCVWDPKRSKDIIEETSEDQILSPCLWPGIHGVSHKQWHASTAMEMGWRNLCMEATLLGRHCKKDVICLPMRLSFWNASITNWRLSMSWNDDSRGSQGKKSAWNHGEGLEYSEPVPWSYVGRLSVRCSSSDLVSWRHEGLYLGSFLKWMSSDFPSRYPFEQTG